MKYGLESENNNIPLLMCLKERNILFSKSFFCEVRESHIQKFISLSTSAWRRANYQVSLAAGRVICHIQRSIWTNSHPTEVTRQAF